MKYKWYTDPLYIIYKNIINNMGSNDHIFSTTTDVRLCHVLELIKSNGTIDDILYVLQDLQHAYPNIYIMTMFLAVYNKNKKVGKYIWSIIADNITEDWKTKLLEVAVSYRANYLVKSLCDITNAYYDWNILIKCDNDLIKKIICKCTSYEQLQCLSLLDNACFYNNTDLITYLINHIYTNFYDNWSHCIISLSKLLLRSIMKRCECRLNIYNYMKDHVSDITIALYAYFNNDIDILSSIIADPISIKKFIDELNNYSSLAYYTRNTSQQMDWLLTIVSDGFVIPDKLILHIIDISLIKYFNLILESINNNGKPISTNLFNIISLLDHKSITSNMLNQINDMFIFDNIDIYYIPKNKIVIAWLDYNYGLESVKLCD